MSRGTLYAGPWVGEFGWELCWWNPLVRHMAGQFDRTVVASHAASEYLYEFADEFIPLQSKDHSFCNGTLLGDDPKVSADKHLRPHEIFDDDKVIRRFRFRPSRRWRWRGMPLAWRGLSSQPTASPVDVMCAFRPPKNMAYGKDYPISMCRELVDSLLASGLTVACFGGTDNHGFDGTVDLRGRPLEEQCSALSAAKCAVGPSSGTMHLASLCGCPHVTWFTPRTHPHLNMRYKLQWNPFGTPVAFLEGHPPTPAAIAAAVTGFCDLKG